jgi:hypothetical protein
MSLLVRRWWLASCTCAALLRPAHASEPEPGERTNLNLVPLLGGNSDIGVVVGAMGAIERLKAGDPARYVGPDAPPYRWRVTSAVVFSFANGDGLRSPYHDVYAALVLPHLEGGMLRLELRPSYTQEHALEYHGLGNAAAEDPRGLDAYSRLHPTLAARARLRLARSLFLRLGGSVTYNRVEVREGSKLAEEPRQPDEHAVALFEHGFELDDRDSEISTRRGQFHRLLVRSSPGGAAAFPHRYLQINLTFRGYVTPSDSPVTLAARMVGDALFGAPPFYELARFSEDTYALGGPKGLRGVPAQRYHGKLKLFGSFEARVRVAELSMLGKPWELGTALFVDAGRLWADYRSDPELDGEGLGLKYGAGGGVRLHQGRTFTVRADVAWSPDARPLGAYFQLGEVF